MLNHVNFMLFCEVKYFTYVVVVRLRQDKNDKKAREETEGKSGRVHRGR